MHFKVEHEARGIDLPGYERLYFDEAFNVAMCAALRLGRTLIARQTQGQSLTREVRVGPERELPAAVAKVLGSDRLEYTEHVTYTLGGYAGTWRTISSLLTDKVESSGTFGFTATASGVMRRFEGDVKVKLFGIGSVVERFIVADIGRSYAEAAAFTQRWIDGAATPSGTPPSAQPSGPSASPTT